MYVERGVVRQRQRGFRTFSVCRWDISLKITNLIILRPSGRDLHLHKLWNAVLECLPRTDTQKCFVWT